MKGEVMVRCALQFECYIMPSCPSTIAIDVKVIETSQVEHVGRYIHAHCTQFSWKWWLKWPMLRMLVVFEIEDILYVQYVTFFPLYGLATGHFQYSMEEEERKITHFQYSMEEEERKITLTTQFRSRTWPQDYIHNKAVLACYSFFVHAVLIQRRWPTCFCGKSLLFCFLFF